MDHALSQILHACNLVKELERGIQNANALSDTRLLLDSCEAIVAAFKMPIPLLLYQLQLIDGERKDASAMGEADGAFFGRPLVGYEPGHAAGAEVARTTLEMVMAGLGGGFNMRHISDPGVGAIKAFTGGGRDEVGPAGEGSSSGRGPAVQKSPKIRKEGATAITIRMLLPADGDKDTPPCDGYMWRKYGRKDILNSTFRRNYYKCACKGSYGCRAKKYVRRLDEDPNVFEVIYVGEHSCNIFQIPLSVPPFALPGGSNVGYDIINPQPAAGAAFSEPQLPLGGSISYWFQMEQQPHERNTAQNLFTPQGGEGSSRTQEQLTRSSNRDVDFPDMDPASAMFNSASSSGNSVDVIFGSKNGD